MAKKLLKTLSSLLLSLVAINCSSAKLQVYENIKPTEMKNRFLTAKKESMEALIYDIINSNFFVKDAMIQEEIMDNKYGIFSRKNPPEGCNNCSGVYIKKGDEEMILILDELFAQVKQEGTMNIYRAPSPNLEQTLAHEIFHDFWLNDFICEEEKKSFAKEAERIYKMYHKSKSDEEKIDFLAYLGYENPQLKDFNGFEKLKLYLNNSSYPEKDLYGTELYSVFAELAYAKKAIIPKQLRKFYARIIAKERLMKNTVP